MSDPTFLDSAKPIYSTRADALVGLSDFHVVTVEPTSIGIRIHVETDTTVTGYP